MAAEVEQSNPVTEFTRITKVVRVTDSGGELVTSLNLAHTMYFTAKMRSDSVDVVHELPRSKFMKVPNIAIYFSWITIHNPSENTMAYFSTFVRLTTLKVRGKPT